MLVGAMCGHDHPNRSCPVKWCKNDYCVIRDDQLAAALFPLLEVESAEFGELVQDIREHGLLQPIVLCDGKILDGRNRYRACQHAGIEPRFEEWGGESPT
jgi:ParB/Sulfiredoxin domain